MVDIYSVYAFRIHVLHQFAFAQSRASVPQIDAQGLVAAQYADQIAHGLSLKVLRL